MAKFSQEEATQRLLSAIDSFSETAYGSDTDEELQKERALSIERYLGRNIDPAPVGRSQVRDRTTFEAVEWTKPSLLRIFTSGSEVCRFDPPDGKRLLTGGGDNTARLWDVQTGEELLTLSGHKEFIWDVAFSPDGKRLATAGSDRTARIWDADSGELLHTLNGHSMPVNVVTFSTDGQKLASAGMDMTARIWDVKTGESLMTLDGHDATVISLAFSPDGTRLVTGSYDESVKVWDVSGGYGNGSLLFSLPVTGWPVNLHFNPQGSQLAAGFFPDQQVRVYILDIAELARLARSRVTRDLTQGEGQQYLHLESCP